MTSFITSMGFRSALLGMGLLLSFVQLGFGQKAPVQDPYAGGILEKVAKKYKAYTSYKAAFQRKTENVNGKPLDAGTGTLSVSKEKFRIESGDIKLYCDGKTLYSYVVSSKECNVTDYEPNPDEVNPIDVFDLYKRGYKYMLAAELKTPTGFVQMIDLEPEDITRDIAKVRLVIDKKTGSLKKYIVTERGTNNRTTFTITSFTPNVAIPAGYFVFDKKAHPGVKLVDLR